MLEIIFIYFLVKRMGEILEDKGRPATLYKILVVVLWIGGEIVGAIIGAIISELADASPLIVYVFALAFAGIAVGILFAIAKGLKSNETEAPPPPPMFSQFK